MGPARAPSRLRTAASRSSSPTIPTATAASPTASASTRRKARSASPRAMREAGYDAAGLPGDRRGADGAAARPGRPTLNAVASGRQRSGTEPEPRGRESLPRGLARLANASGASGAAAVAVCPLDRLLAPSSPPCPTRQPRRADRALGRAGGRSVLRRRRLPPRRPPLRQRRRRHPAGARLRHRSEGDLPRPRPRAAAPLPRLLRLAARESFAADAIVHLGKHGNLEWLPGKALGLSRDLLAGGRARARRRSIYPFIVNDPGEGSQAKRRASRGDRRSPDAGDDARRDPRAARRARDADRRVLRSPPASTSAGAPISQSEILAAAERHGARPRPRHHARR